MSFEHLPKIELHLHLDCSLSFDVVKRLNPEISLKQYQNSFIAPQKCSNLADYISYAGKSIELMQTEEQLRLVTLDLIDQLKKDNVIYAEIRFAPLLHIKGGLTAEKVVETVNKAINEGIESANLHVGIILCTLRNFTPDQSLKTIQLVEQFKGSHVVGFDIAADEAGYPIDNHIKAFQHAKEIGIKCTAHAGEARGADSMWETLENFHPTRIGHGVRCIEDNNLLALLKEKNIHLEICPTSNIQVDVFDKAEDHSIDQIYNSGISISINTDTRTISNVTLSDEYRLLHQTFNWDLSHFKACNLNAIEHAFTTEEIKNKIKLQIEQAY